MSTTPEIQRLRDIAQAEAYVASRFFPPLPVEYGALAVTAVEEFREYGPDSHVNLPEDLNPLPRGAERDEDGDLFVTAAHLIDILRLGHLVDDDYDERDHVEFSETDEDVRWFLNEEGTAYPYPQHLQEEHFPNDDHVAYATETQAQEASDRDAAERDFYAEVHNEEPDEDEDWFLNEEGTEADQDDLALLNRALNHAVQAGVITDSEADHLEQRFNH